MAMFRGIDTWQAMAGFFAAIVPFAYAQGDSDAQATGPLHVHPENRRYFTDDSGKAIYLAGSHTWVNFKDYGITDLSASSGLFHVEWMDPVQGTIISDKNVAGGDNRVFKTSLPNDAVLYLRAEG